MKFSTRRFLVPEFSILLVLCLFSCRVKNNKTVEKDNSTIVFDGRYEYAPFIIKEGYYTLPYIFVKSDSTIWYRRQGKPDSLVHIQFAKSVIKGLYQEYLKQSVKQNSRII